DVRWALSPLSRFPQAAEFWAHGHVRFGSDSVIPRCRFNVRFARRRTWLKGAQHLILQSHIDLWSGPRDARSMVPAVRAVAKIAHDPQRIISEEIGICYRRFGAANPARFFLLLSGRGSRGPLSRGMYRGSDQGPG